MRRIFHPDAHPRCGTCGLHVELCGCATLPSLSTTGRILFLQHEEERHKCSNSVRLACRLCPDLEIMTWPGRTSALDLGDDALILFPVPEASVLEPQEAGTRRIVILDGTWAQASRIFRILQGRGMLARRLPEGVVHAWQARNSGRAERMSSAHAASLVLGMSGQDRAAQALREAVNKVGDGFLLMRGQQGNSLSKKTAMQDSAIDNTESRFPHQPL